VTDSDPRSAATVQPGFVTLEVEWLGAINSFDDGELVHLTLTVVDTTAFTNGIDPQTVTITVLKPGVTPTSMVMVWSYAAWDGVTIQSPAVGTIGRTSQGVFEVWVDTTKAPGIWEARGNTAGAGQGSSDVVTWYVQTVPPGVASGVAYVKDQL
jgi:hypothetical protein